MVGICACTTRNPVLPFADANPGGTLARLAERAAVSRPSLTGLLDGLEARGWVQRVGVEGDRRGVSLAVTPLGSAALKHAEQARHAQQAKPILTGHHGDKV